MQVQFAYFSSVGPLGLALGALFWGGEEGGVKKPQLLCSRGKKVKGKGKVARNLATLFGAASREDFFLALDGLVR